MATLISSLGLSASAISFRPKALQAAADYIESVWRAQGYRIEAQRYAVDGVACANLEVTKEGRSRADEILLLGAHYDTVRGCPGASMA